MVTPENFCFAPGVGVFVRDDTRVQFGLDSTRAGALECPNPSALAQKLRHAVGAYEFPRSWWEDQLCNAGMDPLAARSVFNDLLEFGIIRPVPAASTVVVYGCSPFTESVKEALRTRNIRVRSPLTCQDLATFCSIVEPRSVVVAVDTLAEADDVAAALIRLPEGCVFIPVNVIDNRGIVGPLRLDTQGPCPLCFELHRADIDPCWPLLTRQLPNTTPTYDPVVAASVNARLIMIIEWALKRPLPPSARPRSYFSGEVFDVDLYGKSQHRLLTTHSQCPICFAAANASGPWVPLPPINP
ncbi:MAG: hypothetical protein SOW59_05025 [Corynebacterium sp.]|nr:hypothetical protein [Corynebacterium sp.]